MDLSRPAADPPRQPATAAPSAVRTPVESAVVGLVTAPLPYVVDIVSTVPIRPVVMGLLGVADAVLPPPLCPVIVSGAAAPALPAPPALGPTTVPVTEPAPVLTVPTPPAGPALTPVRAAAPPAPAPAAPPPISVVGPAQATAPTGHLAARPAPVAAPGLFPGEPVAPAADQDAAGVDNGSTPAPGLVRPLDRPSHLDAGQRCDLVPLLVESRTPSAIARPG
ncbi:hypothetical protein ABTW72_02065 [Micromonospora sp. NPDC127501]|uniref:hypothetical protein n=1 Tax=Micromonospora sp. NPDC127501 TaxID=3154872 RepID=UPI003320545E